MSEVIVVEVTRGRNDYVKVKHKDVVYYIRESLYNSLPINHISVHMVLMQYAEYAVDIKKNEVLKCRWMLEEVLDSFLL